MGKERTNVEEYNTAVVWNKNVITPEQELKQNL